MSDEPSNERVEARAYEIYLERGREDGHDVEDWLAAEKEVSQRQREVRAVFEEGPESKKRGYAASASGRRK